MYKINDKIILATSKDGLQGYLTVLGKDEFSIEDNIKKIKDYFKFGLDESLLRNLLETQMAVDETIIAKGREAIDGENGSIKYKIETDRVLMPKMSEDGTVDYRELDSINKVFIGDTLAVIIPPTQGVEGKKVTGESISFKKGKTPKLPKGKNTQISEDGMILQSSVDGLVEMKGRKINVLEILNVDSVDNSVGNIDFNGNVIIKNKIVNGFSVKSKGSVEVRGIIEGGYVECEGDLLVRRGIQGYNRLAVEINGSLCTKFIENACINVKGNITSESIMHSDVTSKSNILLIGKNALIVGGICRANHEIIAKVIGSTMATKTVIEVGIDPDIRNRKDELETKLQLSIENLEKLNKSLIVLERLKKANKLDINKQNLYSDLLDAKQSVYLENEKIKDQLSSIKEKISRLANGNVKVSGMIYPGTKIIIGNSYLNINRTMQNCRFYNENGEVRIGAY